MLNRRGHLGTILLVIGTLVLVVYALFALQDTQGNASSIRQELHPLTTNALTLHRVVQLSVRDMVNEAIVTSRDASDFETLFKSKLQELARSRQSPTQTTNMYARIANGKYSLTFADGRYVLVVNDIFEKTVAGYNEVVYKSSLEVIFDKTKVISVRNV